MKIAVLGPEGTFSDKAYLEYSQSYRRNHTVSDLTPVYCATIDDVFRAVCVKPGQSETEPVCEIGIAPIENTLDGYVQRTLDLLLEEDICILDETMVPVQFSFVGNVTDLSEVRKLYVQFKTNGQCRQFISSLKNVEIITTESNMTSYYMLADEIGAAAIVPRHIADTETKRFVIKNVTDAAKNETRFVIFNHENINGEQCNVKEGLNSILQQQYARKFPNTEQAQQFAQLKIRMPIYIMPAVDRPGILFDILRRFYDNRINLISIMSRPTKQGMGTYNFYIEVDAFYEQLDIILDTLRQIQVYNDVKVLGVYHE